MLRTTTLSLIIANLLRRTLRLKGIIITLRSRHIMRRLTFIYSYLNLTTLGTFSLIRRLLKLFTILLTGMMIGNLGRRISTLRLKRVRSRRRVRRLINTLIILTRRVKIRTRMITIVTQMRRTNRFTVRRAVRLIPLLNDRGLLRTLGHNTFFCTGRRQCNSAGGSSNNPRNTKVKRFEILDHSWDRQCSGAY